MRDKKQEAGWATAKRGIGRRRSVSAGVATRGFGPRCLIDGVGAARADNDIPEHHITPNRQGEELAE